jgi:hypothetical protein
MMPMSGLHPRAVLFSLALSILSFIVTPAQAEDFKLGDVKPGLEGFALTAGVGNVMGRFDVKVLETLQDGNLPMIVIRGSGAFLDAVGGIGQGFSGSPVYVGGKLLGAISGGFPNNDHRLALVTPIEFMRKALPAPAATLLALLPNAPFKLPCMKNYGCAVALSTPLSVSGLSARAVTALQTALEDKGLPFNVTPLQSAQSSSSARPAYKLEPGAPISAQLVTGAINIGAVGAVTAIDGNRVLAFGHPIFGDSRVSYLMQGAYVLGFVNSTVVPFKLAEPVGAPIGSFSSDRPYGVGGITGNVNAIPLEITVKRGKDSNTTKVSLAPVPDIAGPLGLATTLEALDNTLETSTPGSTKLTWRLEFTDRAPLEYGDRVADSDDIATTTAKRAGLLLALIAENPYAAVNLKRLTLSLEVVPYNALRVVKADIEKKTLKAGESTTLNLRLQPYRAASQQRRVLIRIPADTAAGTLHLRVRGAGTGRPRNDASSQENPDPWDGILTFDELLERMRSRVTGDYAVVETTGDNPALIGLESFSEVVTGWAYVDVQVVK